MQVNIEIDDKLIPDGYEAVALRQVCTGELFLNGISVDIWNSSDCSKGAYLILRKKWEWPRWLKVKYIAMDKCGNWYGYNGLPFKEGNVWKYFTGRATLITPDYFDFTPPKVKDWTSSLMENPDNVK